MPKRSSHTRSFVATCRLAADDRSLKSGTHRAVHQRDTILHRQVVASLTRFQTDGFRFRHRRWLEVEMENHGVRYESRFKLLRERLLAMKALWTQRRPNSTASSSVRWCWLSSQAEAEAASTPSSSAERAHYRCVAWVNLRGRFPATGDSAGEAGRRTGKEPQKERAQEPRGWRKPPAAQAARSRARSYMPGDQRSVLPIDTRKGRRRDERRGDFAPIARGHGRPRMPRASRLRCC